MTLRENVCACKSRVRGRTVREIPLQGYAVSLIGQRLLTPAVYSLPHQDYRNVLPPGPELPRLYS